MHRGSGASAEQKQPKRRRRSARRKTPDGRRWIVRRSRELAELYRSCLGDAANDPSMTIAIAKASELGALAEDMRARALRGETVSADDIVRVQRLADAAVRSLHLDHKREPNRPSLKDYLARNYGPEAP
jgi:hypothetical protein